MSDPGTPRQSSPGPEPMSERDEDRITEPEKIAELPYEEAWLVAGRLRADGIPATVFPPTPTTIYGMALTRLFSVLVPRELAEEARRDLEDIAPTPE